MNKNRVEINVDEITKQQQKQIKHILQTKEHVKNDFKKKQKLVIPRKINNCLLYYLLTECNEYTIISENIKQKTNCFIYVDQILKEGTILYNRIEVEKECKEMKEKEKLFHLKKTQMKIVSEIIQKESGITIVFDTINHLMRFNYMIDRENKGIDLSEFFEKYDHPEQLFNLIKSNKSLIKSSQQKEILKKEVDIENTNKRNTKCINS